MMLLARTDTDAPKHKGISYFLLDMKSPGITVRPLTNMADTPSFNEVFFDNVRVPKKDLLGELNRGWYVATTTLDFERSGHHQRRRPAAPRARHHRLRARTPPARDGGWRSRAPRAGRPRDRGGDRDRAVVPRRRRCRRRG